MKLRNDLLDEKSPEGLDVYQLTEDPTLPGAHVYMESAIYTPDGRRMVLEMDGQAHYYRPHHDEHAYMLYDLETGQMHRLAGGAHDTAPVISPDGAWMYFLQDHAWMGKGSLSLMRVNLEGTVRETMVVIDRPLPGTSVVPWLPYGLGSLSSDGTRFVTGCFLGDGVRSDAPWGLLVFDLERATAEIIYQSTTLLNPHPQFCRSTDPAYAHDILVQDNHGYGYLPDGTITWKVEGDMAGADIHVIRDDGSHLRDMPWGRDGTELCMGHQCWRGDTPYAITSTIIPGEFHLIEGVPAPHQGHRGALTDGARRNDISRTFPTPGFDHFATDRTGDLLITDYAFSPCRSDLYMAQLGTPLEEGARTWRYLLNGRSGVLELGGLAHLHPTMSPDGKRGFFNSTESGKMEAYMITGLSTVFE